MLEMFNFQPLQNCHFLRSYPLFSMDFPEIKRINC